VLARDDEGISVSGFDAWGKPDPSRVRSPCGILSLPGGSAEVIGSGLSFLRAKAQQHGVLRAGR